MEALKTTLKLLVSKCANLYSIRKCFVDAEEENAAAVGFKIKQEIFKVLVMKYLLWLLVPLI
jgi:hypothetical protein